MYVVARDPEEGIEFARRVAPSGDPAVLRSRQAVSDAAGRSEICISLENGREDRATQEVVELARRQTMCDGWLAVVGPRPENTTYDWTSAERAIFAMAAGSIIQVPPIPLGGVFAERLVLWFAMRQSGKAPTMDEVARRLIQEARWRGGLAEVASVGRTIGRLGVPRVTAELLQRLGWGARTHEQRGGVAASTLERIRAAVGATSAVSASEVRAVARVPARTVNRGLRELVLSGEVERLGHGRATQYRRSTSGDCA